MLVLTFDFCLSTSTRFDNKQLRVCLLSKRELRYYDKSQSQKGVWASRVEALKQRGGDKGCLDSNKQLLGCLMGYSRLA